jgi:hypothetical protein
VYSAQAALDDAYRAQALLQITFRMSAFVWGYVHMKIVLVPAALSTTTIVELAELSG